MSHPVRLGVIGCGKHAHKAHGAALQKLQNCFRVDALYDPNSDAVESFCGLFADGSRNRLYRATSEADLFAQPIDAVLIATPPKFHINLLDQAITAGRHVMCEKPLWDKHGDNGKGNTLLNIAREEKLIFTSCHPRRFEPMYKHARLAMLEWKNRFGPLQEFNLHFFYHEIADLNHELDLANFLLGHASFSLRKTRDTSDCCRVVGSRDDGVVLNFCGYRMLKNRVYAHNLELVFASGTVRLVSKSENGKIAGTLTGGLSAHSGAYTSHFGPSPQENLFVLMMSNFHGAVCGREQIYTSYEDLLIDTASSITLVNDGYFEH